MNKFKGELVRLNTQTGKAQVYTVNMGEPESSSDRKSVNIKAGQDLTLHCTQVLEGNKKRLAIKQP